jgi:hypothetical protein
MPQRSRDVLNERVLADNLRGPRIPDTTQRPFAAACPEKLAGDSRNVLG